MALYLLEVVLVFHGSNLDTPSAPLVLNSIAKASERRKVYSSTQCFSNLSPRGAKGVSDCLTLRTKLTVMG